MQTPSHLAAWTLSSLPSLMRPDCWSTSLPPLLDHSFRNCQLLGLGLDFLASIPDGLTSALRILHGPVLIFQFPDLLLGLLSSSHGLHIPQLACSAAS